MFTTPLKIIGSKDELNTIEQDLLELGYRKQTDMIIHCSQYPHLSTNIGGIPYELGYTIENSTYDHIRIIVQAKDKELILALATMQYGDFKKGEWLYKLDNNYNDFIKGKLYRCIQHACGHVRAWNDIKIATLAGDAHFRRATKEEIIEHFKNKEMLEKKITDWKVLKEFPHKYLKIGNTFKHKSICYDEVKPESFPGFFESIYEEDKREVSTVIELSTYNIGNFLITINKNGLVKSSSWKETLSIQDIKDLISCSGSFAMPTSGLNANWTEVHIGCEAGPNVKIIELKKIVDIYEKEFNS